LEGLTHKNERAAERIATSLARQDGAVDLVRMMIWVALLLYKSLEFFDTFDIWLSKLLPDPPPLSVPIQDVAPDCKE